MRDLSGAALAILSALTVVGCGRASTAVAPATPATRAQDLRTTGQASPTRSGADDAGRFGRLAVMGSTGAQVVTLDGEPVLTAASVEAEGLSVDHVVAVGAHDLALVEVDGAAACPVRYVVLDTSPSRATRASPPFGTCAAGPRLHVDGASLVIDLPSWRGSGEPTPAERYIYADGAVKTSVAVGAPARALDVEDGPPSQRPSLKWIGPQGCRAYAGPTPPDPGSQVEADALATDFETTYPKALGDPRRVDHVDLTPERLDRISRCLAALSSWPGSDGFVPDEAAALFASRRYGSAALAALERLAASPHEDGKFRAAARTFAGQMRSINGESTDPNT